jgi:hypothetical protein
LRGRTPKGLNAKGVERRELRELQGPQAAIFTREASRIVRRASVTAGKWKASRHGVLRQAEDELIGNANNGTMEHPGTILDDWDGVIMAGAGYSEEALSEGDPDVLDEK